jgi:putative transposase
MAESFFATLEREVLERRRLRSQAEARMAIFEWIEGWYNPHRHLSGLGYRSPRQHDENDSRLKPLAVHGNGAAPRLSSTCP